MSGFDDYDTKPIGGKNPYYCCADCEVSVPQINGKLERHHEWCKYRKKKEAELTEQSVKDIAYQAGYKAGLLRAAAKSGREKEWLELKVVKIK